jgi:hypothetical protein
MFLQHVKGPLRYARDNDRQNSVAICHPVSPCFATRCLLQPEQRTLVDESGLIKTQMGSTVNQKMVIVAWGALMVPPPPPNTGTSNLYWNKCH